MENNRAFKNLNARLYGEPISQVPRDLYIPPDALEIILEAFEGPLDLLIYLIRKENFNILDIPMAQVTSQYLNYVDKIREHNLELAAEYLLMAAVLIEIKARMLIPRQNLLEEEDEVDDPRAELVRQLIEYEKYKRVAKSIDEIPRVDREISIPYVLHISSNQNKLPEVSSEKLFRSLKSVMLAQSLKVSHSIAKEILSVRDHMTVILKKIKEFSHFEFINFFASKKTNTRMSVVVHFLALLELAKSGLITVSQAKHDAPIWISGPTKNDKSKID
ncbi:MAG: segregation and condensation protein A [Burkholderiaceae bacterium]